MNAEFEALGEVVTIELVTSKPEKQSLATFATVRWSRHGDLAIAVDDVPAAIEALQAVVEA